MKRCPECFETYEDSMKFCDGDGTPLVDETTLLRAVVELAPPYKDETPPSGNGWVIGTFGVAIGVMLCLFLYVVNSAMMDNAARRSEDDEPRPAAVRQSEPARPLQVASALTPAATPTPAESPMPEAEEPEADVPPAPPAATPNKTVPAGLNNGPVSTGAGRKDAGNGQTVIQMKDGTAVEVEAAWEDGKGIWYRRSGIVTFVARDRVEAITGRSHEEPTPTPVSAP